MKPTLPINLTRNIPQPTYYVRAINEEFSRWAFNEERVLNLKGRWRKEVFSVGAKTPLDLEIGVGNGYHFAHRGLLEPHRYLVGLELKYKPLIQAIRRALKNGCKNVCVARYHGRFLSHIFEKNEIDNVYIHFPDPWEKPKQNKHRLIQLHFLNELFEIQKPCGFVEFKTDSRDYFDHALQCFEKSSYELSSVTYDLHKSNWASTNFVTHFEKIFISQNLPIYHSLLKKP